MKCRHCGSVLNLIFADLGTSPPSNSYLSADQLNGPEEWFPLRVLVCTSCFLVQTEDFADREKFFSDDYAYFSSMSSSWLRHCEEYTEKVLKKFSLNNESMVIEVAANDGYLLQYFLERGIKTLGIEPTTSTANVAREKGIDVVEEFFGEDLGIELSAKGCFADLIIANNVLAHVPDINDFILGFKELLKPEGVATFEFPHLFQLICGAQFDTIYHEHYSYLSLFAVEKILKTNGLEVFDVEELETHGGSLRVYAKLLGSARKIESTVSALINKEIDAGINSSDFYEGFQERIIHIKNEFNRFLLEAQDRGEAVAAYGAAAKGNTLLNYCGIRSDLISFVVDKSASKQGKFLPGSRIPVVSEEHLQKFKPECIIILPWNLTDEIMTQLEYVREWGGKFITAVPALVIR
jgi:SAM-dependent methyltransferase